MTVRVATQAGPDNTSNTIAVCDECDWRQVFRYRTEAQAARRRAREVPPFRLVHTMSGIALKCVECDTPLLFLAMTKLCPLGDATVCPLAAKPERTREQVGARSNESEEQ